MRQTTTILKILMKWIVPDAVAPAQLGASAICALFVVDRAMSHAHKPTNTTRMKLTKLNAPTVQAAALSDLTEPLVSFAMAAAMSAERKWKTTTATMWMTWSARAAQEAVQSVSMVAHVLS